ncbi:MAG: hypothetical protein ACC656_14985 [Candidatus Heimdallarchaeota archaeon]
MKNKWEKDINYEAKWKIDEIYHILDNNGNLEKKLRIVHYHSREKCNVFYSVKTTSWIDPNSNEIFIEIDNKEFELTYEEATSKFFYAIDLEALKIINTVQDFY